MKIKAFLLLIPLLTLTACSNGKQGESSAKLEITNGFAVTNTAFEGGLIIYGKNTGTGAIFSVGLLTTNSYSVVLPRGNWIITATAWDGVVGGTTKPFGGTPYCGRTEKTLTQENETISLSVSPTTCASDPIFSANRVDGANLKSLSNIVTCNSFFNTEVAPGDNISSRTITSATPPTYCEFLDADNRSDIKGLRIRSAEKTLKTQPSPSVGLNSGCISNDNSNPTRFLPSTSNPYATSLLRIPYGQTPIIIEAFKDINCTQPITNYVFMNGLSAGNPQAYDHLLLNESSNQVKLILPGNDVRRARSPFMGVLPSIKKDVSGTISRFETAPTLTEQFYVPDNSVNTILIKDKNCAGLNATGAISGAPSCTDIGDDIEVTFTSNDVATGTPGNIEFTVGAATYDANVNGDSDISKRHSTQKTIIELLGNTGTQNIESFFWSRPLDENIEDFGVLGRARDMLAKAGGIIGMQGTPTTFTDACMAANGTKEVSFFDYEEMQLEHYKVIVHNDTRETPSAFFCNLSDLDDSSCASDPFDKRMMIYDYSYSTLTPSIVIEFNCDNRIGRMEIDEEKTLNIRSNERQEIITWNTGNGSSYVYQRFERQLILNGYLESDNTLVYQRRNLVRLVKSGVADFEFINYDFDSSRISAGNWRQNISSQQVITDSTDSACYYEASGAVTNADPAYVLTTGANPYAYIRASSPILSISQPTVNAYGITTSWGSDVLGNCYVGNFTNPAGLEDIDGDLPLYPSSLSTNTFMSKFGGSFMTSP